MKNALPTVHTHKMLTIIIRGYMNVSFSAELNSPQKVCSYPSPLYLYMWPYLELGSLQMYLS